LLQNHVRRFSPGERIVFLSFTDATYARTQAWLHQRKLSDMLFPWLLEHLPAARRRHRGWAFEIACLLLGWTRMALLIKAEELKGLISIPEAVAAVREGFRDQGEKPAYSAPRIRIQHEDRRVSVHTGGCHRLQVAGTFIHVERFTFRGGAQQYERAGKRIYVAYDSETAELMTIIVGSLPLFEEPPKDWFGTETPITSAVGTDVLARPDCRVLGLYGTGRQARRHLVTLCTIRTGIEEARIYSRSPANRAAFLERMQPQVRCRIVPFDAPEHVAHGADLICLATSSNVPVLFGAWLSRGQHVTSIVASNKGVYAIDLLTTLPTHGAFFTRLTARLVMADVSSGAWTRNNRSNRATAAPPCGAILS
jgi:ornithine cyclodeaminase/alanine dehydrogenase-like protein (mu-crystallin family)